jgi:uncharacterized protein (TIRG00374 family)
MAARTKIRRVFSVAVAVILLYVLFYSYVGLSQGALAVARAADWKYLMLAAAAQIAYFCFFTFLYQRCFKVYGVGWKFLEFLQLFLASIFAGLISFVGGALANGVFLRKARKEGVEVARVINALFLVNLADFAILSLFLIVGVIFLSVSHDVAGYEIFGIGAFALLIVAIVFVLVVGNFRSGLLAKFFGLIRAITNAAAKFFGSKLSLAESWPKEKCVEFSGISKQLTENKNALAKIAAISILAHLANALTLFFCFFAFGYRAEWEAVVTGYGMGMLFTTITITPQGLGVVDGVIPAIFKTFGAALKVAVLSVFAFRLLSLWLPALAGFFAFNQMARGPIATNDPGERTIN